MNGYSHPPIAKTLRALFEVIVREAETNAEFAEKLKAAFGRQALAANPPAPRKRRNRAPLDPFTVYVNGEQALREALNGLDAEALKDVIAEHGMDQTKLAMRWKATDRLVELIVDTVKARTSKGEAFIR